MFNPSQIYPANVAAAPGFPYGKPRNKQFEADPSGTPLEEQWLSDVFGVLQAMATIGDNAPNGQPESTNGSQVVRSLRMLIQSTMAWPHGGLRCIPLTPVHISELQPNTTWVKGIYAAKRPRWTQQGTVANYIIFEIPSPLPDRMVISGATVTVRGASGHGTMPGVKPNIQVYRSQRGETTVDDLDAVFDPTATVNDYEEIHDIELELDPAAVMSSSYRYWLKVTGESGPDSVSGLELIDIAVQYTTADAFKNASTLVSPVTFP